MSQEMMSLNLIEAFVEVARRGSVTAAARALGRSQPAVSHRLRQLEEQLGVALFEKAGRGVRMTQRGEWLLEECEQVLARLRAMPALLQQDETHPSGEVVVGTFATLSRYALIEALEGGMAQMEEVKWVVEIGVAPGLFDRLRQGHVDVLYLIGDYEVSEEVEVVELGRVRSALMLSPALWSAPGAPPLEVLRDMRLLLWKGMRDPSFELIEAHARSLGLMAHNTLEVPQIETLKELAIRGAGYAILPDYIAYEDTREGRLRAFPFEAMERSFPLKQYVWRGRHVRLAQRRFQELVKARWREGFEGA